MTLKDHVDQAGIGRRVQVQFRHKGPMLFGNGSERCGRVDHAGRADNQEHVAISQRVETLSQILRIKGFSEPDNVRTKQAPARRAFRQEGDGHVAIDGNLSALRAPDLPDVPVNLRQALRSRQGVEPINVLRDEPKLFDSVFQFHEGGMGRIRLLSRDEFAAPVVPFPYECGIARKGLG